MAHCHPTDLSSGTHNLYDSAKKNLHDQTFPGSQNGNSTIPGDVNNPVTINGRRSTLTLGRYCHSFLAGPHFSEFSHAIVYNLLWK